MSDTTDHDSHKRIILPDWMQANQVALDSFKTGGRNHSRFLKRSIVQIKRSVTELLMAEEYARYEGLLQSWDPRLKMMGGLALLMITGLTRSFYILGGIWLLTVVLMWLSRLPVVKMQFRIWCVIPLITLIISAPAMLNLVNDGTPLWTFYQQPFTWWIIDFPAGIYISHQGFTAGIYLFARVGLSLSVGALLTLTTPAARLFKSLLALKAPAMIVTILEMSYRYLVLLLNLSLEMFEARSLRTVGRLASSSRRAQVGSSMAALFAHSIALTDEIYLAMTARGYTGDPVSFEDR